MLRKIIQQEIERLPFEPATFLVAVSGGSDSFALLDLVNKLNLKPICLHVNHNLREESDDEEQIVRSFCQKEKIPFRTIKWSVPAKNNIEAKAREFRYTFFEKIMQSYERPVLLLGHHKNDQVETIVQKVIEGSLSSDLTIPKYRKFSNGYLLRPLLTVSKKELQEYAEQQQLPYIEDSSNFDLKFKRNQIRHEILPYLLKLNPQFINSLLADVKIKQNDEAIVLAYGDKLKEDCRVDARKYNIDILQTKQEIYAFVRSLTRELSRKYLIAINYRKWQQIMNLIEKKVGNKELKLNKKYVLRREYQYLSLVDSQNVEKVDKEIYTLNVNDKIQLSAKEWLYFTDKLPFNGPVSLENLKKITWEVPCGTIQVRLPMPGDRLAIAENKHKKVARILIDSKIPSGLRSKMYVILSPNQEILGILPLRKAYLSKSQKAAKMYYITYYYENG